MATGDRFVRRHDAARSSTSNTTAADISYNTAVISETIYSWASPEVTVSEAGLYLTVFDLGQCDLNSTRAVGTLVPSVNTTDQTTFRATHRYTRNSGGAQEAASIGMAILDLAASDDVKVRNPGALTPTDAVGNYATNASYGGGLQLIKLPANNFTHVERTSDAAEVGQSNINTTRPWLDSSGTWTTITYNSEVNDDDSLYSGSGGDLTLKANTKYMVVWGATIYSTDSSRHTNVVRLQINSLNVQSGSGYHRNSASQGTPICGMYLHETGGSTETLRLQATHETEGGDAGTPNVSDAYLQVIELPSTAEWIHADNGTTDSLTTELAGTTTWYDTPLSSSFRADGNSDLSLDSVNDAIQNDSGASLPVLAIGWHRFDRDSISSGNRKNPWTRWDNGGSAVGYGVSGSFSRGQQSGDDTWQAHHCSAVTLDLADSADLSFQVNDEANANNSDFGIYASTSRYFLGVQVLNLETLDAGTPTDALLADDIESDSETSTVSVGQEHGLLSNNVQSTSSVSTVALGQIHALNAVNVESNSSVTQPGITEANLLLTDNIESSSNVSIPDVAQVHLLTSVSVQSNSETSSGTLTQVHSLLTDDVQSNSEADSATLGQVHNLTSVDVESNSEVSAPSLVSVSGTDNLLANDIESSTEVSNSALGQIHTLLTESVESNSEVSVSALAEIHQLNATDIQSNSEVSTPTVTDVAAGTHALFADNIESISEVTNPRLRIKRMGGYIFTETEEKHDDDEEVFAVITAFLEVA